VRRELWWGLIAIAALAVTSIGAQGYARLAAPYYATVARLLALAHPWQIVLVEVRPDENGPGSAVVLIGDVRREATDANPAVRVVSRVQVGEAVETPVVFWTMLLLWPAVSARQRLLRIALGVPMFLGLEAVTTVIHLTYSLTTASDILAGENDPITAGEHWSRFLEAGGHFVVEVCGVLLTVALAQWLAPWRTTVASSAQASAKAAPMG
jgi:hypothetical protein